MSVGALLLPICPAWAQQVVIQTPQHSVGERFFEISSVNWSFLVPGSGAVAPVTFRFGSPAAPPFGGFDPQTGISTGMALDTNGFQARLFGNFSQGIGRTHISTTSVVTLPSGVPGFVGSRRVRPFVIGIVPLARSVPDVSGPVRRLLARSDRSNDRQIRRLPLPGVDRNSGQAVAQNSPAQPEIVRRMDPLPPTHSQRTAVKAAARSEERQLVQSWLGQGRRAEAGGRSGAEKVMYRMAARRGRGRLQQEAAIALRRLTRPAPSESAQPVKSTTNQSARVTDRAGSGEH